MKQHYPLMEHVTIDTLQEIADRRFPEYSSYNKLFLGGKAVCIDRNPLYRAIISFKHNPKKGRSTLVVNMGPTVLGSILVGAVWGPLVFRGFLNDVEETFRDELHKLERGK